MEQIVKKEHRHYKRTTEIAEQAKQLYTGEGQDELIIQYKQRESKEQKDQRIALSHKRPQSVLSFIRDQFERLERVEPTKSYVLENQESDLLDELAERVDHFHADESLQLYLAEKIPDMNFLDPNAFIVVQFDSFDPNNERAKPYPKMYKSENCIDFEYKNGVLEYLTTKNAIKYTERGNQRDGFKFIKWQKQTAIEVTQVGVDHIFMGDEEKLEVDDRVYSVLIHTHTAEAVPAMRVGYLLDPLTDFETCVPVWYAAKEELMELINIGSQYDITKALHTFLQKIQYVDPCQGENNMGCKSGIVPGTSRTCSVCNGTGFHIHKGAQDVLLFIKPRDKEDMIPLKDLVHYVDQPEKVLEHQKEEVRYLRDLIPSIIFSADQRVKYAEAKNTATEVMINSDKVNDKLYEMGQQLSKVYKQIVGVIGDMVEIKVQNTIHKYPADFRVKTVHELLLERSAAVTSKAPAMVLATIDNDIIQKKFEGSDFMRIKFEVMEYFRPFKSMDRDEVLIMLSDRHVNEDEKALHSNFDRVFSELEEADKEFYYRGKEEQRKLIYEKARELVPPTRAAAPVFE